MLWKIKAFLQAALGLGIRWHVAAVHFLSVSICVTLDYKVKHHVCSTEDKWLERVSINFTCTMGVL